MCRYETARGHHGYTSARGRDSMKFSRLAAILFFSCSLACAQTPAPPAAPPRPVPPTRSPDTPGYVDAKALADGVLPAANQDGNFILGPTHAPAPETLPQADVPHGDVSEFVMDS